ncbi:type VII secretion system-associated protein [Streptomyces brevispora]|uniref:type VII secretion system-associated protein n=1 Tax=Streptomyces brevispora TaxID=887462 RepID=UPI002E2F51B8|nr:type VII secretion system-associated protein [Streptomyces brevispora]
MAADPTNLSHLDTETLQKFIDTDVQEFIDLLGALEKDTATGGISALKFLSAQMATPEVGLSSHVLKLGKLVGKDATPLSASPLVEYLTGAAESQAGVISNQLKLFNDIQRNMKTVLATMKKNQADSLDDIKSQEFLNDLGDVDGDLAPTQKA